ncbi:MAG TPA: hypothetical protein VEW46_14440 [Pyrinomonadaceae bacterium]|nr:hypothetical protein [Pyrinomonadaceae bacterium]
MKKFPVLSLILIVACSSYALGHAQSESSITNIRRQYAAINKRTSRFKKVKKELSGFSLEGGQLIVYFDGPAIVKLVATHYGEMGRTSEEYYYLDGKLIFVFEKVSHYNKPMSGKVVRTVENRYYFDNDQMIRWLDQNQKQGDSTGEEFRSKQKDLLETSNLFVAGARSKTPAIEK